MQHHVKPLVAAIAIALNALALSSATAQTTPTTPTTPAAPTAPTKADEKKVEDAKKAKAPELETIIVTGIRASLERSLDVKRDSSANVEVITAEDVGKMPDKNLADSLQRLAGVAVRTDYDEAEKVSIRGTNPDMSLILFNGHTVSGGDWFIADQNSSSRSTSLSLMPSSVLNQAQVYKTSQANIVDGGLAGTINVTTRKPLNEKKGFGGVVNAGGVYSDLPGKWSHQLNASLNWKNDANTLGFIGQVFAEKRFMRRDSVSRFAYGVNSGWDVINTTTMRGITDASLAGSGFTAADLNGVRMPGSLSTEFVESVRDRKGGMFAAQFRPTRDIDVTVTSFSSKMNANNYGRLTSGAIYSMLLGFGGTTGGAVPTTLSGGRQVFAQIRNPVIINTVSNYGFPLRVLQSADIVFPDGTSPQYVGNSEGFYRDGASATSGFTDVDAKWRVNEDLTIKALFSTTKGVGETKLDQGATFARFGTGLSYRLGALRDAPFMRYINSGSNVPGINPDGSGYRLVSLGASGVTTTDKESSIALDATYNVSRLFFTTLEAGYRFADHERFSARYSPMRRNAALPTPPTGFENFPSNFGNGFNGNFDTTGFFLSQQTLRDLIASQLKPTNEAFERRVVNEIDMRERQTAFYLMQNMEGDKWSGNIGLRFVQSKTNAEIVNPVPAGRCQLIAPDQPVVPCVAFPTAINTAASSPLLFYDNVPFNPLAGVIYYKIPTERVFNDVLPSINLRFVLAKNVIARFGASKTIGRQNYNVLGSGFGLPSCNASGCTVTGPNPNLKPLYAKNVDLSLAWYFARRSVASVNYFQSNIDGYIKTGAIRQGETIDFVDPADNILKPFFINSSSQQGAKIRGVEVIFERPIAWGFGMTSNFSMAKTKVEDGRPMIGASNKAMNLGVYFENNNFSTRVVYNYRDRYVASTTAPAPTTNSQATSTILGVVQPTALTWAAPVSNIALSMNYSILKDLRIAFDVTNLLNPTRAQYRYSEDEQQKLDVSGRQYFITLRYRF